MSKQLPWVAQETPSGKAKIVDAQGFSVVNTTSGPYDDQRKTAAFIVRAVNSHDQMTNALRLIRSQSTGADWTAEQALNFIKLTAEAALAAAEA